MALLAAQDPKYDGLLRRARGYVVGSQVDTGEKGKSDEPFDGGVGYSNQEGRSDMNNTLVALEALYHSRHLVEDKNLSGMKDLNWPAALHFIQNCQNLPGRNRQAWVSTDPKDQGGFVYDPDSSKAGVVTNVNGRVALRSYGSISYAGLLSYIYADVKKSDPRVQAVLEWLHSNLSLDENPGMGAQGYFYYLHLMAKALSAAQVDDFEGKGGRSIDWRQEVAMRLISLQKADGSWQNENGRWWEKDPTLVSAYSVMTLEIIYRGM
jgi:squalene-hopene/tetraprenyl-beta-curcumene cyclase